MAYFLSGISVIISVLLGIRALGFVEIKKNYWIKLIGFSVINTEITIYIQKYWRAFNYFSLLYLITMMYIFFRVERNNISKSIFSIFSVFLYYFILDMIAYPIVRGLSIRCGLESQIVYRSIASLVILPITIIISKLLNRVLTNSLLDVIKKTLSDKYKNMFVLAGGINLLSLVIVIIILKKISVNNYNFLLISTICALSYFIIFTCVVFIVIFNLRKGMLDAQREVQLKDVLEYNENLEELYNDMRRFRHDYINILSSMAAYIDDGDLKGLEKYFKQKIAPLSNELDKKNSRIGYLHKIKVKEIKGILLTKSLKAQEKGLDVFVDVEDEITNINMDVIDICTVLGILLDNALEEASKYENGYIKIGFVNKDTDLIIVITNLTGFETPPIYKLFEKGFSTKGQERGIGLSNLRKIISKYQNVFLDTSISNGEFKQVIEVQ